MITCTFEDNGKGSLRHVTMTALVAQNDKILLVKRAEHLINGGKYALPGGFLSRDETIHQGVVREIQEETGYTVENIQLFRINDNPQRPREDRQNVDFVFIATAGKQVSTPDNESSEVGWFSRDQLPSPDAFAFDHLENIELYKKYLQEKFPLPILPK